MKLNIGLAINKNIERIIKNFFFCALEKE